MSVHLIGVRSDHERVDLGHEDSLDEAQASARTFLEDPRDTIQAVYLWEVVSAQRKQCRGWLTVPVPAYSPVRGRRR